MKDKREMVRNGRNFTRVSDSEHYHLRYGLRRIYVTKVHRDGVNRRTEFLLDKAVTQREPPFSILRDPSGTQWVRK